MGSGKTTTATSIAEQLALSGLPARPICEGMSDHPVQTGDPEGFDSVAIWMQERLGSGQAEPDVSQYSQQRSAGHRRSRDDHRANTARRGRGARRHQRHRVRDSDRAVVPYLRPRIRQRASVQVPGWVCRSVTRSWRTTMGASTWTVRKAAGRHSPSSCLLELIHQSEFPAPAPAGAFAAPPQPFCSTPRCPARERWR